MAVSGAALLWVGWFGFNGGSALVAGTLASTAVFNTRAPRQSAQAPRPETRGGRGPAIGGGLGP